jgi:hypothetical protein
VLPALRAEGRRLGIVTAKRRLTVRLAFDALQSAKAAGVTAIAVTWGGFHSRERLAREEPDAIVETPEELLGRLYSGSGGHAHGPLARDKTSPCGVLSRAHTSVGMGAPCVLAWLASRGPETA